MPRKCGIALHRMRRCTLKKVSGNDRQGIHSRTNTIGLANARNWAGFRVRRVGDFEGMNLSPVATRLRVMVCVRGGVPRRGVEAMALHWGGGDVDVRHWDAHAVPTGDRGDLLIVDYANALTVLSQLPQAWRPRRTLLLTTADAPHPFIPHLREMACGRVSLIDAPEHVDGAFRHALSCPEERPSPICRDCQLPKTLRPRELPLSRRELEVFLMLGHGGSATDISSRLGISVKTFETHRERIKRKLDVETAGELMAQAVAWQRGLLGLWGANAAHAGSG